MGNEYDIEKWKANSRKDIFLWQYYMSGYELPGWRLKETRPWENIPNETVVQYYWESNSNKDELLKIDIIECRSWIQALDKLLELLRQHMHIRLPEAREKIIPVGDAAYTGDGAEPQHLLFARANVVAIINSIGKKVVPVAKAALQLDSILYEIPRLSESGVLPGIESFDAGYTEKKEENLVQLRVKATDPLRRRLWYKFISNGREIIKADDDNIYVLSSPGETNQVSVYVFNENGNTVGKTIDL
jgi:hypothetical protein